MTIAFIVKKSARVIVLLLLALQSVGAQQAQTCTIHIQARLYQKWGPDAIPPNKEFFVLLEKRTFYLMDADPSALIKAANLPNPELETHVHGESDKVKRGPGVETFLAALEAAGTGGSTHLLEFYRQAYSILKPHRLQKVETDRNGKAVFQPVKPGVYYIMGRAGNTNPQVWSLKVDAKAPSVSIILGDYNSLGAEPGRVERSMPFSK